MKHIFFTFALLLLLSVNVSFAADENKDDNVTNTNVYTENVHEMPLAVNNIVTAPSSDNQIKKTKKNKRMKTFFKNVRKRLSKKFEITNILAPQRILVLMIIGFLLLLPGMILAVLGVALIPAIILALLGGTLMIIGVLAGS